MNNLETSEVISSFKSILERKSPEEQYQILMPMLANSNGYLKWRIKAWITRESTPDLLTLLPPEIQLTVLEMVDGSSLLKASQVSKTWNNILKSHNQLWKVKSLELGVNMVEKPPDISWNVAFSSSRKQLHHMERGTAFKEKFINLQNCKKSVKAIDYNEGYLCAVSDEDRITIWQLELNFPVLSFLAIAAISCIKFKPNCTLVCGHFTGILTSWDLSDMSDHHFQKYTSSPLYDIDDRDYSEFSLLKMKYMMHSGPVFNCDFSEDLQLLISGSADETIKLWCLISGQLLHTLACQNHWILKVIFVPFQGKSSLHSLFTMTRDSVCKFDWKVSDIPEESIDLSSKRGDYKNINLSAEIKLNQNNDNFITPGLQMSSRYIGLVKQDLQEKQANLVILHSINFLPFKEIPLGFKVRKLLALGNRYALLLTVGKVLYTSTLVIVDIITGSTAGTHVIPHSKMTTPDGAQIIVGDTRWLDGLTGWNNLRNVIAVDNSTCGQINILEDELDSIILSNKTDKLNEETEYNHLDLKLKSCDKLQAQQLKSGCSESRNLVLAAGIQDDIGRVFTLWWKNDHEDKRKID